MSLANTHAELRAIRAVQTGDKTFEGQIRIRRSATEATSIAANGQVTIRRTGARMMQLHRHDSSGNNQIAFSISNDLSEGGTGRATGVNGRGEIRENEWLIEETLLIGQGGPDRFAVGLRGPGGLGRSSNRWLEVNGPEARAS